MNQIEINKIDDYAETEWEIICYWGINNFGKEVITLKTPQMKELKEKIAKLDL